VDSPHPKSGRWPFQTPRSGHPIFSGLIALVTVAVVVGLFLGLGAIVASRVLGFGGSDPGSTATEGESMFLPEPQPTTPAEVGTDSQPDDEESTPPAESASDKPNKPVKPIRLTAAPQNVATFERVNLTGSYPSGDGAILQVERRLEGAWEQFDATISVNGDRFASYVETGRQGKNEFRVVDTDNGKTSNVVAVTVR
jgi:hypothetical protein